MKKREKLLKILKSIRPDIDFETKENLIDDDIFDSFDIITLIGELNQEFNVNIGMEELEPENFNSATAILHLIDSF